MYTIKDEKIAEMKKLFSMKVNNRKYGKVPIFSYNNPKYLTPFNSEILNFILHFWLGIILNAKIVTIYAILTNGGKFYKDIFYIIFYPFIILYNLLF